VTSEVARVTVLMPTYAQAHFIERALDSLLAQELNDWQLVIVDDGSPDETCGVVEPYLGDQRIELHRLASNRGLGGALNYGLERAVAGLIAYLPSDDVIYPSHLAELAGSLEERPDAILAYSGVRNERRIPGKGVVFYGTAHGQIAGYPLQLVQVMHRRTGDRWLERPELTTDDLERMFWSKLRRRGEVIATGEVSCEWVDHPLQRHKLIREPLGGVNPYRWHYRVPQPLRFHSSVGNPVDEVEHYRRFRERADTPPASDALTIVLVGELAFNPERVLALEERGHKLYGLWTPDGHWFNTVGPLPFGHVQDLPRTEWDKALRRLQPDVIYALLNWEAVPFAHAVLTKSAGIPFVWHFKEGPFDCIANGTWALLAELCTRSDGQIYSTPEMREWFAAALPRTADSRSLILDGDLPKREWFQGRRSPLLSAQDGEVHTVVPGGPIGLDPELVGALAREGIHLHFYGNFHQGQWPDWIEEVRRVAASRFHLHHHVDQDRWVSEFSQYDAGWLHLLPSDNGGDLRRATWGDLNYPARIPTLASAGVPLLQLENGEAIVATQTLARELDLGLFLREPEQLGEELRDRRRMAQLRENAWRRRDEFTFDHHADRLLEFFLEVIAGAPRAKRVGATR
jgi:Glycosyl transferase family 2